MAKQNVRISNAVASSYSISLYKNNKFYTMQLLRQLWTSLISIHVALKKNILTTGKSFNTKCTISLGV